MSKQQMYPLKYLLKKWGNVNHYQSVLHPLSTLPAGIGDTLAAFKTNQ